MKTLMMSWYLVPSRALGLGLLVLGFLLGGSERVCGQQINWRGLANKVNLTSAGALLDESFIFELGSFQEGFVPTSENTDSWAAQWQVADRAVYRTDRDVFTSSTSVISNDPPQVLGRRAYVWGYRVGSGASEWFLAGKPSWTWPSSADSQLGGALTWVVSLTGLEVVVGAIGTDVYITTASVDAPLPLTLPSDWQASHFTSGELVQPSISSWSADPDHDGLSNQFEYAFALDPWTWSDMGELLTYSFEGDGASLTLTKPTNRLVRSELEYAVDAIDWRPLEEHSPGRFTADVLKMSIFETPATHLEREFYRIRVDWMFE